MNQILLLAAAGAIGAVCRYTLCKISGQMLGDTFPYGTLIVNVIGCGLLGFLMQLSVSKEFFNPAITFIFTVGFLGAFTTFSSFSYETLRLFEAGLLWIAAVNIAANLLFGLSATILGAALAKITL